MKKIKWGVIGAGGIADRRTIPEGILCSHNSELVAISDVNSQISDSLGSKYEVPSYIDPSQMLENESLDALYIAVPTCYHKKWVLRAAVKGIHVLCEKPLGMNSFEAYEMVETCKTHNVKLGVGFMMRYHSYNVKLKEIIEQGELGIPVLGRAQLTCWYPPIKNAWRQTPEIGGGGSLIDMGSHCIDLLETCFGQVVEVGAFVEGLVHDYEVEDSSLAIMKFANGALGIIDNNFNIPDASALNILEVYGSLGSAIARGTIGQDSSGELEIRIDNSDSEYSAKQQRNSGSSAISVDLEPRNIYQAEIDEFVQSIIENVDPPISGEVGVHNMKVIEAIYESAQTKRFIKV